MVDFRLLRARTASPNPAGSNPSLTFAHSPTKKFPFEGNCLVGAGGGIRTPEGESRQIYSLLCLTASLPQQFLKFKVFKFLFTFLSGHPEFWSRLSDSNRRPTVYKTVALTN
jgi:hypothetical protein